MARPGRAPFEDPEEMPMASQGQGNPLKAGTVPRLVGLTGDQKGLTFPLPDAEFTFGRVRANHICIPNPHVSRRHAKIWRQGSACVLTDLESQNGTFVNDAPIREHTLTEGDEIRIADQRFVFLTRSDASAIQDLPAKPEAATIESGRAFTLKMTIPPGGLSMPPAGEGAELDPGFAARLLEQIDALRGMAEMLVADADPAILLDRIARVLLETFRAERSCILIADRTTGNLVPSASAHRKGGACGEPPISQTVVQKVAAERVSLLCQDAMADTQLGLASSVAGLRIRSVMSTPLILRDRLLGALYLDNRSLAGEFSSADLWLFKAMANQVAILIDYLHMLESLRRRLQHLQEDADHAVPAIVGESRALSEVVATGRKAAGSNATILILGESGTGKEVLARGVHRWSPRRDEPFVVVNCAALADQLLQSDLFGHERGAFTGAIRQKRGRLEVADGGTVFLDEIGEIDREMQAKFLRFLQEREFERLGGTHPIRVDVRVIAASNRDLAEEVRAGRFREDLYYRLRVVEIVMPPLRERRGDIPLLAEAFLREYAAATGREVHRFSPDAMNLLKHHTWQGNIRELRNCIERAVVLGSGEAVEAGDLGLAAGPISSLAKGKAAGYREQMSVLKREVIQAALDRTGGQHAKAAAALGLRPAYLSRLMKNLGMR
jgi:transcriptional regulator with GAF, ATPase, and Fis domain